MSEREMDEAKARKFRERLERISRRRFMKMATLGGAAAMTFGLRDGAAQGCQLPDLKTVDKCWNTRELLRPYTVNQVFRDRTFSQILDNGMSMSKLHPCVRSDVLGAVKTLVDKYYPNDTLSDFYRYDRLKDHDDLKKAIKLANQYFVIPFILNHKHVAEELLGNDPKFLQDFGREYFIDYLQEESRHKIDGNEEKTLNKAHKAGFFRDEPPIYPPPDPAAGNNQCACQDPGWECKDSQGDKCTIAADGFPMAGSDICPPECRNWP